MTERTLREWKSWKSRILGEGHEHDQSIPPPRLDTVGAIALDARGELAAAVSRYRTVF